MEIRFRCDFVTFLYKIWSSTDLCSVECQRKTLSIRFVSAQTYYVGWSEAQARWSRRAKRFWVHPWLPTERRLQCGRFDQLIRAMSMEDSSLFFNYMRMEPLRIGPRIQKSDTNFRRATRPGVGQNAKSVEETWQKRKGWLCLNSHSPRKRVGRSEVVARAYGA